MARDDLPDRAPKPARNRSIRFFLDSVFSEYGPAILGLEHGFVGVVLGVAIWLIFGLIWLAFIVASVTFVGLQRRGRR